MCRRCVRVVGTADGHAARERGQGQAAPATEPELLVLQGEAVPKVLLTLGLTFAVQLDGQEIGGGVGPLAKGVPPAGGPATDPAVLVLALLGVDQHQRRRKPPSIPQLQTEPKDIFSDQGADLGDLEAPQPSNVPSNSLGRIPDEKIGYPWP